MAMSEAQKAVEKRPAPQPPATEDFSQAIEQTMDRQPDEQVRCVRVFEDRYRCNWWVREKTTHWMSFSTGVIRKSLFLRVTQNADKLVIEDLSRPR
jgi:hypothetical protein